MSVNYSFLYVSISVIPVIVFNIVEPREKVISTSSDNHFLELVMLTMYINTLSIIANNYMLCHSKLGCYTHNASVIVTPDFLCTQW